MDLQKIKSLITLVANSSLAELELEEGECVLRLVRNDTSACPMATTITPASRSTHKPDTPSLAAVPAPTPAAQVSAPAAANAGYLVKAPMFGVFCLTPAPKEPPFVQVGDTVKKGQKLCMLEAMKLFHVLEAERDGTVVEILADNGQEVDADQPLLRLA